MTYVQFHLSLLDFYTTVGRLYLITIFCCFFFFRKVDFVSRSYGHTAHFKNLHLKVCDRHSSETVTLVFPRPSWIFSSYVVLCISRKKVDFLVKDTFFFNFLGFAYGYDQTVLQLFCWQRSMSKAKLIYEIRNTVYFRVLNDSELSANS